MRKLMITTALIASLTTLGYSQDKQQGRPAGRPGAERPRMEREPQTPEQRAQRATDALEKKLSLTADQKVKIYALNLERAQKMGKTMKAEREYRKEQLEKQKSYMEETDKKLSRILSDEQKKSYEEMKKDGRERMKARRPGSPGSRTK